MPNDYKIVVITGSTPITAEPINKQLFNLATLLDGVCLEVREIVAKNQAWHWKALFQVQFELADCPLCRYRGEMRSLERAMGRIGLSYELENDFEEVLSCVCSQ